MYHIDTVSFFTKHTMGNKISHILFFTSCFNWLYLYIYILCQSPYQLLSYHQFYSQFYTTYLIHDAGNIANWYYQQIGTWFKELSLINFTTHIAFFIILLFTFAILIDQPRKWIWKLLLNYFNIIYKKV